MNLEDRMFTGIVTDIGKVVSLEESKGLRVTIECSYKLDTIPIGASIAHDGICLTITEKGLLNKHTWYTVDISQETISKTSLSETKHRWKIGSLINLERSLKIGDELGGHIVSGHVDGVAEVVNIEEIGESTKVYLKAPQELAHFIAKKGSIALNGTSLTVNEVTGNSFEVNLIPHTKSTTTWETVKPKDKINLEVDTLARYVARLNEMKK